MKFPFLFEFMDLSWLPESLRATLREILECGSSAPLQDYYLWVHAQVCREVTAGHYTHVVEMGAGTAPVSRLLAGLAEMKGVKLVPCDSHPQTETYRDLDRQYPGRLLPIYEPVDFTLPRNWPPKTLLLLAGAFHHVPPHMRPQVLANLSATASRVMVVEPVRKTALSMLFVFTSILAALLLPIWFFRRRGKLRRFFWCWILPVAGAIFWWEGLVSCARMWDESEWRSAFAELGDFERTATIETTRFRQCVVW